MNFEGNFTALPEAVVVGAGVGTVTFFVGIGALASAVGSMDVGLRVTGALESGGGLGGLCLVTGGSESGYSSLSGLHVSLVFIR